jgi:hypothetical protein
MKEYVEPKFFNGSEVQQVIADTWNIKGQLWLYVNKHPDNQRLLQTLFRVFKEPYATYTASKDKAPGNHKGDKFGFEWIFPSKRKALKRLRELGFKLKPGENAGKIK